MSGSVSDSVVLHVRLNQEDGWPPVGMEEIRGIASGDHEYVVASTPWFARELAIGDVVRVAHHGDSGTPWLDELVSSGSHSTVRVIVFSAAGPEAVERLWSDLKATGCVVTQTTFKGLTAVDVPADVDYGSVVSLLSVAEDRGVCEYEEGAISEKHRADAA